MIHRMMLVAWAVLVVSMIVFFAMQWNDEELSILVPGYGVEVKGR